MIDLKKLVSEKAIEAFFQGGDSVHRYQGRLCVLNVDKFRDHILKEALSSQYSIHLEATYMYYNLWEVYWWNAMKMDIAEFVAK